MITKNPPLKVVHLGVRAPVFPTQAVGMAPSRDLKQWGVAYLVSLLSVYVTLKLWWEVGLSYTWMFYAWVIIVPFVMAAWARTEKKSLLFVALTSGLAAWCCDIFMLMIVEG